MKTFKMRWLEELKGGNNGCIEEIAKTLYPFITKMSTPPNSMLYTEVTVRLETDEKTRFGKDKPQRRRLDAVSLVKPHYKAWGEELFSIGFEMKESKSDLMGDEKYVDYLGFVDFFFWVVPSKLVSDVMIKVFGANGLPSDTLQHGKSNVTEIGIIEITENGYKIVKMPERQAVSPQKAEALLKQIVYNLF